VLFHFGPFDVPVEDGVITSYFGDRRLFVYVDVQSERSVHTGIDLAAPAGTPVLSSGGGRVALAVERLITGNTVVIEHLPGVYSLYYHLEEIRVDAGGQVSGGSVIGTIGSSGLATGPHLHWEIRVGGVCVDPSVMTGFSF
jgi:murein DD-endopeptidase MepM/ murein hydrolase activator NlpD